MLKQMLGCYILFSEKLQKFYIGVTQENVESRIEKHNTYSYGKHRFTAKADDWALFLFIQTDDYSKATRKFQVLAARTQRHSKYNIASKFL